MPNDTILIIDDEESIRKSLRDILADEGYEVATAGSGREALDLLLESQPALALLDIAMPDMDGIETLKRFKETRPEMQVIMITGHGTIDTAVQTTKMGAYDFLQKPLSLDRIVLVVKNGLAEYRLRRENESLRKTIDRKYEIIGASDAIAALKRQITLAAPTNGWVLIHGESGSGKELVARAIHRQSKRSSGPFVEVNCAAIPQELIESELFGHEKGAFTGSTGMKRGKFELADRGTIFLDEIADMSLATQAKVLRVLEGQEFQRVGGTKTLRSDMRVIAASNKDLGDEIGKGAFREDLFYRLNVVPFEVPPLRDRRDDIPVLIEHFLREFAADYGQRPKALTPDAIDLFLLHSWKGNVRELRNFIERLMIMTPGPVIGAAEVPPPIGRPQAERPASGTQSMQVPLPGHKTLKEARAACEREFITRKLRENNGNISKTADEIDVERSNLHRKIKALNIETG